MSCTKISFWKKWLFCFIISLAMLLLLSRSSFFYSFNDWVDANAFFTVGKSLFNGKVIFKDIFEQKGPLLYFIYGIGYLLSNTTFHGVFMLEVLSSTIFLYYIYQIISLYLDDKYGLLIIPLFTFLIYVTPSFERGSSCEEFCLPFLGITIYYLLRYVNNNKLDYKEIYLVGFLAGLIFLMKYTLLGISFAFMIYVFINKLINKQYKQLITYPLTFLLGMITPIIPWIVYFIVNAAVHDFLNVYLLINLSAYSKVNVSIFRMLFNCAYIFLKNLKVSGWPSFICFCCLIFPLFSKKVKLCNKLAIICTIFFGVLFIYIGGVYYIYYILPMLIFTLFLLIYICFMIKDKINISNTFMVIYIFIILVLSYFASPNTFFIGISKEKIVPYQFKDIILEKEGSTILNYGVLDYGFYTVTNIVPNVKYFAKTNIVYDKYPENMDQQNEYIKNKEVDFVIVPTKHNKKIDYHVSDYLEINYKKVAESKSYYTDAVEVFSLYELKDNS